MKYLVSILLVLVLLGCSSNSDDSSDRQGDVVDQAATGTETATETETEPETEGSSAAASEGQSSNDGRLARVLDAQTDETKARYEARHPRETLEFFGIEPGMTVVEGLPGGGWYTKILLPYLGSEGELIAANYPLDMWPNFPFADEAFMERIEQWPNTFLQRTEGWCEDDCAPVSTFWFGSMPADLEGSADAVLFIRVLHNMAAFQNAGIDDYLDQAFADAHAALKPGGILGVVQHAAREDMPDDWADGSAGYLKKTFVIERARAAGFELVDQSDVNSNPNDRPSTDEVVWRLPPSSRLPEDTENPEMVAAEYESIGESNRMTLKFRKSTEM